ncbi:MAG: hypothetical protein A3I66_17200 [Burkholderiales bacterium RIFCSPLOWO2_02_FULL_57_36]|nr:MAG: hypothetical protein A3I66_17200 [Burkholderiales bacterium RIFCSPLOWO2_02_FULL_57_36]
MRPRHWFRVHSWIGVIGGLLLFVLCWAGTVATLSHEIDWVLTPASRVQPGAERASPDRLYNKVKAVYPQASIARIHAPLYARSAAQVIVDFPNQRSVRVYLDPYTAEVLGSSSYFSVQRFFRSFHISLFNNQWGLYLVWLLSIPLLVSMIAPLVFYKRWWSRFFDLKTGRGSRVFWSNAHKLTGLWSLWFVLVIAVTGVWFLFEAIRYDLIDGKIAWANEGKSAVNELPLLPPGPALSLKDLLARVQQERPELEIKTLGFGRGGYFYVDGQAGHLLVRDRANKLYFDASNGVVIYNQRAADLSAYWRWSDSADPLHFGDFGGLPSKLIWFVFGLGLSGMCLTGTYLHVQRLGKEAGGRERARWPGTTAAMIASLLVLAGSMHGGWQEIKDYGPVVNGSQQWPDVPPAVTVFIAAWVLLTLGILGYWVWMLWRSNRPVN